MRAAISELEVKLGLLASVTATCPMFLIAEVVAAFTAAEVLPVLAMVVSNVALLFSKVLIAAISSLVALWAITCAEFARVVLLLTTVASNVSFVAKAGDSAIVLSEVVSALIIEIRSLLLEL